MYRDIPHTLRALVEPVVEGHGLELVDAELAHGPGGALVRVVIDTPAGDGLVPIERCAAVSRELNTCLEAESALATGHRLEVSSPGLDRVLAREKDFAAACGSEVRLETRHPLDGRRHFRGELVGFERGVARVRIDGREFAVPFDEVARARRVHHYTSADFGTKAERRQRRAASGDAS